MAFEQVKAGDGTAGTVGFAVFPRDDDGGLAGLLDDARGENADDAPVPAVAVHDDTACFAETGFVEARRNFPQHGSFGRPPLLVETLQLCSKVIGAVVGSRVVNSSITSEATSMRPAALIRGARRKATSMGVSGRRAVSICASRMRARNPSPTGRRNSAKPTATKTRFSPRSGTASAMVAMASIFKNDGRIFVAGAIPVPRFQQRLRKLERDASAAQMRGRHNGNPAGWDSGRQARAAGPLPPRASGGR